MNDPSAVISRKWPDTIDRLERINRLRNTVASLNDELIFEPVSVITWAKGKPRRYADFTPFHLIAGLRHASSSARSRMTMLEDAAILTLGSVGTYPAAVLIRSHMEAAGLAAIALVEGTTAIRSGDIAKVQNMILSLLFGTSLRREGKKNESVDNALLPSEMDPLRAAKLIEALDRYVAIDTEIDRTFRSAYALLCEYAHATMRVSSRFVTMIEPHDYGWLIQYGRTEATDAQEVEMILKMLHNSMRVGHSCAEMLQNIGLEETDGGIEILLPSEETGQFVWTELLQYPIS
jgi:hypothetical protein